MHISVNVWTLGAKLGAEVHSRSFDDVTPRGYQVVVADGTAEVEFLRSAEKGSAMRKERYG